MHPKKVPGPLPLHCLLATSLDSRWPLRGQFRTGAPVAGYPPTSTSAIPFPPGLFYVEPLSLVLLNTTYALSSENPAQGIMLSEIS